MLASTSLMPSIPVAVRYSFYSVLIRTTNVLHSIFPTNKTNVCFVYMVRFSVPGNSLFLTEVADCHEVQVPAERCSLM